jgi:hypothetical protein
VRTRQQQQRVQQQLLRVQRQRQRLQWRPRLFRSIALHPTPAPRRPPQHLLMHPPRQQQQRQRQRQLLQLPQGQRLRSCGRMMPGACLPSLKSCPLRPFTLRGCPCMRPERSGALRCTFP